MNLSILLFIEFIIICASEKILEIGNDILSIYDKPQSESSKRVVSLAQSYLNELRQINISLHQKQPEAIKIASILYSQYKEDEVPKHCGIIPYGKFIDIFGWEGGDISDYHNIVSATRWVWDDILRGMGKEVSEP
uniref:Uncharacterized protein n=1 Tax=Clastoptera arizonana TaxID=38151 RepID=A0A1B6E554_9HEMI